MTNAIEQQKTFEERMMSKIKESIGDMITDDELKRIVEKGMEVAFFQPQPKESNFGRVEYTESLAFSAVKEHARTKVNSAVNEWMKNNPEKILEIIDGVVRDGIVKLVIQSFEASLSGPLQNLRYNLETILGRPV